MSDIKLFRLTAGKASELQGHRSSSIALTEIQREEMGAYFEFTQPKMTMAIVI